MKGKRILSFILALVMVLGMIPFNALEVYAATTSDPTWDATATDPYIIHVAYGEADDITEKQLYELLDEKWDTEHGNLGQYGGFKYGENRITGWANDDLAGLVAGTVYSVSTATITYKSTFLGNVANGQTWTEVASFKVVEAAEVKTVTVQNSSVEVDYNMGKDTPAQWEAFRNAIIAKVGTIQVNGTTVSSDIIVKFHHKTDGILGAFAADEYLVLNAENASKYDESNDKATFTIGYDTATPATITVTRKDSRPAPITYTATAESKNGTSGIQSAAATAAQELGLAAADFTAPADWQTQMADVAVGGTKTFAVTASYGGGTVYKAGTVTVNVTVTKSALVPATVTVSENEDGGNVVITNKDNSAIGGTVGTGENPLTITVTPAVGNGYSYYVESITLNGNALTVSYNGNVATATFSVENSETETKSYEVVVNYRKMNGNTSGTVDYYATKPLAELKAAIFNAIVKTGATLPAGITVNDVDFYYYQYHDAGIGQDGFNAGMILLGNPAQADDTSLNPHTYYDFGERFLAGGSATEKVRISGKGNWAGLYVEAEITLKHDHVWDAGVVTPPTCTADGYTTHTCTVCGDSYTDTPVTASGHSEVEHEGKAATCTEAGYEAYVTCNRCDLNTKVEIPATNHKDTLVQVEALAATCTTDGYNAHEYCTACDYTTKVVEPMSGHDMRDDWYTLEGSVSCGGSTLRRDCHNAGCTHYETKAGDGAGHAMGDWYISTPATCTTAGEKRKDCANCDHFESEVIPATNHVGTLVQVGAQTPDCDSIGWDAYEYCTACTYTTYVEKAALEHGHDKGYRYDDNQDGTHDVFCLDCQTVTKTVNHAFNAEHVCECEAVETFTITFKNWDDSEIWSDAVEYNTTPEEPTGFAVPANHTFAGWDSSVTAVNGPKTYTATYTLNANNGELSANLSTSGASANLANLREKVLTGAGLPTTSNYTVTTVVTINYLLGETDVTLNITESGVAVQGDLAGVEVVNNLAAAALADALQNENGTQKFTITDNTTGISKTVSHSIVDIRLPATVDPMTQKNFGKFDTQAQFEATVKAAITASWENREGQTGAVDANSLKFTFTEVNGPAATSGETVHYYNVTVTVNAGTDWLASESATTFEGLYWTVNQYTVTWKDGNGATLKTDTLDYGVTPSYTGETPTKTATAQYTYTFNNTWSPAIAPVNESGAIYIAQFDATVNEYKVTWLNGNGTEIYSEMVPYGTAPEFDQTKGVPTKAPTTENGETVEWTWDVKWTTENDLTDDDGIVGETVYSPVFKKAEGHKVTFMNGENLVGVEFVNTDLNETTIGALATVADPTDDNLTFVGWYAEGSDVAFTTETVVTEDITLYAKWVDDKNNNNVDDELETATITVTINGEGSVSLTPAGNATVTKNADGTYTVLFDSTNATNKVINVTATPADTDGSDGVAGYVVSATQSVTVEDGQTAQVEAEFALHSMPVAENPAIVVNGKDADSKLAIVTKRAVLETVLGRTVSDAEFAQYEVKVKVNAAGYNGYVDIWALIGALEGKTDAISTTALAALKSAFNTAIDVGGSETFEITWLAHDKYPEVKTEVNVKLVESRDPTTVTHKDGITYTATILDEELLEKIKVNLSSNTNITTLSFAEPKPVLTPGATVDVQVIVNVEETDTLYGASHTIAVKVNVPASDIDIKIPTTDTIYFNTGMSNTDKVTLLKKEVPYTSYVAGTDILATDVVEKGFKVQYLASTARNVPYTINVAQLDLGLAGNFLPDTIEVQIPVDAMWLDMATMGNDFPVYEAPSNDVIREILLNDLIPNYAADYMAGNISNEQLKQIAADLLAKHPDIANYYKFMGAHQFGELEQETIRYVVESEKYGSKTTNECVLSMVDDRAETEIKLNEGVEVTYNSYTEAELLALILDGVYANGQKVDGAKVEFVTDVEGLPAADVSEVTVKFAGDEANKPSKATVAIKINKAPVNVSVDNRLIKWQENLTYAMPITTTPAGVDTINFIVGLDVEGLNVDGGIKGLVGKVQLMLPEELQDLLSSADALLQGAGLNVSFANGASMKLSELQAAVDALDDIFAGSDYEEYFRILLNMLKSLPTDVADVEIVIGGNLPTNIGAYLVGAVSADANYTTDFGVGVIVITPDGIKADIAWNQNDDNYIVTNSLLTTVGADGKYLFDTAAHATAVGEGGTIEEATAQIAELFLGVDIDGNITLETDQTKLNVGAYVEVAMVVNWGNQMYYSAPIARPIVVIAETLDVDFVDASGAVNNERHFEFFNVPQDGMEGNLLVTYKKDGNGYKAGDKVENYNVKYFYVGVQTNAMPYASTTAPTHAGAYTITAIVTVRDGDTITHAGQGIGALVIEPSKSTTDVENEAIKWDGSEHTVNQFVDVNSVNVPGLKPDKTVISAGIHADLDANIGLEAIKGSVNIDMPTWMDELMKKFGVLEAGYADGITVTEFKSYVEKLEAELVELGVETDAFAKIVNVVNQLSDNVTLTFHDDKGYSEVGAYLIVGIVTDSDHYPSADAGIMVIYPDATKVDLKFNKTWDGNNVFTWNVLKTYDLNAKAYTLGTETVNEEATAEVTNLFVGFADHGELILTTNDGELDNGVYAQVAFILQLDNVLYYAEPIAREVIIVPNPATIDFVDDNGNVNNERHFEFFNVPHAMDKIRVTLADGQVLDLTAADEGVDIYYVGVMLNGQPYAGYDAPVHAGVYEVTAQYTARDDQNRVVNLGVGAGVLVIEPSKSETAVDNAAYPYGEAHSVRDLIHASSVNVPTITPDTTVISAGLSTNLDTVSGLDSINGTVNVDLPTWLDEVFAKLNVLEAGYADGISAETFLSYVEKIEAGLVELGVETESFDEIVNVVKQLPITTNLTFHDDIAYTEVGAYLVIAVVTDSDHYPSVGAGVLVIYPDATEVELKFNETWDDNNIFTWQYLQAYDLDASAYLNGAYHAEATELVKNLYIGVADHAEIILTTDKAKLDNGAYTQVALLLDLGNVMYYAKPISRVFVVVPNPASVDFLDENGEVNNNRLFQFSNQPHAMDKLQVTLADGTVRKVLFTSNERVDYFYVGVQSNGIPYASKEAPIHAGIYEVTAQYTARDDQNRVVDLGVGAGVLVIEPSKSETTVDNIGIKWDGNEHKVSGMITAESINVPGLRPDTTVISAGLSTDLDNVTGLDAINGTVNVDLPTWMDKVMNKLDILDAGYADGISAETFLSYVDKIREALAELNVDTTSFDKVVEQIERLPITTNLTFTDDIGYTEVGAYLVVAVVTDSNHYPSVGAGIMVIYPDATKAELCFEEDWNGNNIFTWAALQNMNLDAQAFVDGAYSAEADALVTNVYLGIIDDGKVVLTTDKSKLDNGVYTQFAFLLDLGNVMYYAEPVSRVFMIVPTPANIEFLDQNGEVNNDQIFTFNNEAHEMPIRVTIPGGEAFDPAGLIVNYVGVQTNGELYNSAEAPVHSGAYVVTAKYTARDDQGRLVTLDVEIGAMVIEPAKAEINVDNTAHEYDGNAVNTGDMVHINSGIDGYNPNATIITAGIKTDGTFSENLLDAINSEINIDLPDWADKLLAKVDGTQDGITVAGVIAAIEKAEAKLAELAAEVGVEVEEDAFDGLTAILKQLPANYTVTFNDAPAYKEVGAYLVIGVVTDSNCYPAMDAGVLVIYPDVDEAKLNWIYEDSNNIFTLDTLAHVNLGAYATVDGAVNNAVPFQILYLGVNANTMEIVLTRDQSDLTVGNYTEIAYVLDVDSQMYVAEPIIRNLTIVQNVYEVLADDATYTYDGTGKIIDPITVLNQAKEDITAKGELTVTYMGLSSGLEISLGQTAPVNAGIYKAVITFVTYDEDGYITGAGSKVVDLTIKRADPDFDVTDAEFVYDGTEKAHGLVNTHGVDYIAVIETEDGVNLVLTDGLQKLADFLGDEIYDLSSLKRAIENAVDAVEGLNLDSEFVDKLLATIEEVNDSIIYKITVNGANPVDAGTYKAYAITVPTANFGMDVSKGTLVILPKQITSVEVTSTHTYSGSEQTVTFVVKAGDEVLTVSDYTVTGNKGTNAGDYTLTVTGTGNYTGTVEVEWNIAKKEITAADVALDGTLTYNGAEQTQNITVTDGVTYTVTGNKGTNAGDYTLTVTGTGNYTGTVEVEWNIAKTDATVTAPTANELTYTGAAQALVTAGTANGGTMLYSLDGQTWSEEIPTGTEVGQYTVYYYVKGDENHSDSEVGSVVVTIAKANVKWAANAQVGNSLALYLAFNIPELDDITGHYAVITRTYADGKANQIVTVNSDSWKTMTMEGEQYYYVKYDPLAAKEMTDELLIQIFDENGNAITEVYTESMQTYAMRMLNKHDTKSDTSTIYAQLLVYGTAAQNYFGYNLNDLADAEMTDLQKTFAMEDIAFKTEGNEVEGLNYVASNLQLQSTIKMYLKFTGIESAAYAKVSFTNHKGQDVSVTIDAAEFKFGGTAVMIDELVAADYNVEVNCTIYDAQGNVLAYATDSVENYIGRNYANHVLYEELLKYMVAAHSYFH